MWQVCLLGSSSLHSGQDHGCPSVLCTVSISMHISMIRVVCWIAIIFFILNTVIPKLFFWILLYCLPGAPLMPPETCGSLFPWCFPWAFQCLHGGGNHIGNSCLKHDVQDITKLPTLILNRPPYLLKSSDLSDSYYDVNSDKDAYKTNVCWSPLCSANKDSITESQNITWWWCSKFRIPWGWTVVFVFTGWASVETIFANWEERWAEKPDELQWSTHAVAAERNAVWILCGLLPAAGEYVII